MEQRFTVFLGKLGFWGQLFSGVLGRVSTSIGGVMRRYYSLCMIGSVSLLFSGNYV